MMLYKNKETFTSQILESLTLKLASSVLSQIITNLHFEKNMNQDKRVVKIHSA